MTDYFSPTGLRLITPPFESELTDIIIELDHLRTRELRGSTPPKIFFQLKSIFHFLESIGSARIEGNRTTITEYVEAKLSGAPKSDPIMEIENMEQAMRFVDQNIQAHPINKILICEIHRMTVQNLKPHPQGEGDSTPGEYRKKNVKVTGASFSPPDYTQIPSYMQELFDFAQHEDSAKYDLLKAAIVHHRFAWIHPFGNGNGRTVRLLTYAMLVKQGFNVHDGRILNPTAVFCSDRDEYYKHLALADEGTDEGILKWAHYVLKGLREEITKIDNLLNYEFLKKNILLPTLDFAREQQYITHEEKQILNVAVEKQIFQAGDLKPLFPKKIPASISRIIRDLREKNMVAPINKGARKYVISFENSYLLRGIIQMLEKHSFIPLNE